MKTTILAAATAVALGVGSAYAFEGGVGASGQLTANPGAPASAYFAAEHKRETLQQFARVESPFRARDDNGQG